MPALQVVTASRPEQPRGASATPGSFPSGGKPLVACRPCEAVRSVCPALVDRPGGSRPVGEAAGGKGGPACGDCGSHPGLEGAAA